MRILSIASSAIAVAALALSLSATSAKADLICVEDDVAGCVGAIPTAVPTLLVGSDGESPFDPFGAGFDLSDGIVLNDNWAEDPAFAGSFSPPGTGSPGLWQQLPDTFTWVLPASIPGCGAGKWIFLPGSPWNPGTPVFNTLIEADGSLSDIILLRNDGPGGSATITFCSDPNLGPCQVPEPASMAILGAALSGMGGALSGMGLLRRRRREG
jgi:hypothetical protein